MPPREGWVVAPTRAPPLLPSVGTTASPVTPTDRQSGGRTMTAPTTAPTLEQVRAAWDGIAPRFDEHVTPQTQTLGARLLPGLGVTAGTHVLDVAAGTGALALPAARLGAHVTAVDVSPVMVERLAARARTEGLDIDARVMDANALDLADGSVDVSVSQHGVSVLPDMARGLREMARVTRPGGRVLVVAFGPLPQAEFLTFFFGALRAAAPGAPSLPTDPPPPPFQAADPTRFTALLTGAGLSDVHVRPDRWELTVRSAQHLWDVVTSSNPIGAGVAAALSAEQAAEARRVLDGMLRERSGGTPGAVLRTSVNVGTGTA